VGSVTEIAVGGADVMDRDEALKLLEGGPTATFRHASAQPRHAMAHFLKTAP
jgi:hypothetical protein